MGRRLLRYERTMAIAKRHRALLALIDRGCYSGPQLAEELGVSSPTVSRDIVFLRCQGYEIESARRKGGWAYELTGTPKHRNRTVGGP